MDTPTASVKKIALNYGLLFALAGIAFSVILYVTGNHIDRPWWAGVINFVIAVLFIVYGLKAFKNDSGGFMSLGQALKTGVAISLVASLISAVYSYIFMTVIEPDFQAQIMEFTESQMYEQNPNLTAEQAEMALGFTEKLMSPGVMIPISIIAGVFFGFIIALVAGLIMKQNRPEH